MPNERRDLNLFRVFTSIMEHRNLAMVGRELGLSASAISHALTRLRATMGDDLFVPSVRGMQPTPYAVEITPRIVAALGELRDVMARKEFEPTTSRRTITIGASDYSTTCLLPPLVHAVLHKAPHVRLRVMPIGRMDLVEQLDVARLDVVVGWFDLLPAHIHHKPLIVEEEALVVRHGHPLASGSPDVLSLLSFPHLIVEFTGANEGLVDGFLSDRGLHRRVWVERLLLDNTSAEKLERLATVTIPTFAPVPFMLQTTNLIATVPLRLARLMARDNGLQILDLPYQPKQVTVETAWHERGDQDGALQWLLAELEAGVRAL